MKDRFFNFIKRSFPLVAFAMIISNFALSCSAIRSIKPQNVYQFSEVTNYVYSVSSNVSTSVSSVTNIPSVSPAIPPREEYAEYDYFVNGGCPCVRLYGKYFFEGDVISYGRIFRIFPDRLFLMNGDIIINSKFARGRDVSPRDFGQKGVK